MFRRLPFVLPAAAFLAVLVAADAQAARPDAKALPLADAHLYSRPYTGRLYACRPRRSEPNPTLAARRPWVNTTRAVYWPARAPRINGTVTFPDASFTLTAGDSTWSFSGDGRPLGYPAGEFPGPAKLAAYSSPDGQIRAQDLSGSFRAHPVARRHPACVDLTQPIAIATDGVPVVAPADASGHNLVARTVADTCGGRLNPSGLDGTQGRYEYLPTLPCLLSRAKTVRRALVPVAFARDGYPVVGPRDIYGRALKTSGLDACHGRPEPVLLEGKRRTTYAYHLTRAFPYLLGCFHASPSRDWRQTPRPEEPSPTPDHGPAPQSDPPADQPPPPPTSITTSPGLYPDFSTALHDYVAWCGTDPVGVDVQAGDGTSEINGGDPQTGASHQDLAVRWGAGFTVTINRDGQRNDYHVRCLPPDFPDWSFTRYAAPRSAFYLATPTGRTPSGTLASAFAVIFDSDGVPVWWYKAATSAVYDAKIVSDGSLGWWAGASPAGGPGFVTRNLDGSVRHTWQAVGQSTDNHDFQLLPNGDALLGAYAPRPGTVDLTPYGGSNTGTVLDPEFQEIAPDGHVVWSWNGEGHLDPSETAARWWGPIVSGARTLDDGRKAYDYAHWNSIEQVGDDTLVFSARHLDAVYGIDKATGDIVWKLGGTSTPQSLTVLDDPDGAYPLGGQHYAYLQPDGTLTLHDNNTGLSSPPRAVRYQLDLANRTATLLESVSDPDAPTSPCCGSSARADDGSWLMQWGGDPVVSEFAPDGSRTFQIRWNGGFSYRMAAAPAGALSIEALRAGMDAQFG